MLFPIRQLIEGHELLSATQDKKVRDALATMLEHDYSQLPIVDTQGYLTGIITEQSIVNTYYIVSGKDSLLDMTVDHCQTVPITISADADIFDALDLLRNTYAIVVTENQKPIGILTDYDTTEFFRNYSEGLIQVQDVEVSLRQYIEAILDTEQKMKAALVRAFGEDKKEPGRAAKEYEDLTFWETVLLITTLENWPKFEHIFTSKPIFQSFMEQVRDVRNQLAHFRGELTVLQKKAIKQAIAWLAARPKIIRGEVVITLSTAQLHATAQVLTITARGKYAPLEEWLGGDIKINNSIRMNFVDIEKIIGEALPDSAHKHRAWWANDYSHPEAVAWMRAGWLVDNVDFNSEEVTFRKSNQALYPVFFTDLLERFKKARPGITQAQKASLQNWLSFSSGISGFIFGWVLPKEQILRVELYIDKGEKEINKATFESLKKKREEIESEIGEKLTWEKLETARACRIYASIPFHITHPPEEHETAKRWGVEMMLKIIDVFQPRLRGL